MQKVGSLSPLLLSTFLVLIFSFASQAQVAPGFNDTLNKKDTLNYYDMSLEQLQKLKAVGVSSELEKLINSLIGVASKKPLSARESPSIVSLITEDEIKKSGARDLMDVLNLVPGIDFGVDVEGVVGIGIRGNWAHEGKVLLLLDGQEMNEGLFGSTQFGNHYPVDQIKRIEIIRGPGSAIYGGYAEYGVINIITKNGEDINGVAVSGTYGQMKDAFGRKNVNLSIGKKIGDFQVNLAALMGQGNRSDQIFKDFYGGTYKMAGNSNLDPANLNLGLTYKGLSFRGMLDNYYTISGDDYTNVKPPYKQTFNSSFAELKYNFKINNKLSITPKINYKEQIPWKTIDTANGVAPYYKIVDRYTGNLTCSYNITRKINLIAGGEVYNDKARDLTDSSYFSNGKKNISYINEAVFAQSLLKFRLVNVILGARFDKHSEYGSAFVPRIGLTKRINKFHFKLLYSNAFRAPSIENINLKDSTGMKPETTTVAELELGYQIGRNSILTVNLFNIDTRNAIVYYVNAKGGDAYHNSGKNGSKGVELEYKIKEKWGYINLNYAYYSAGGMSHNLAYEVPQNSKVLLAFPSHKINLNSSFNITKHLSVNPSLSFRGDRYAYTSIDTLGNPVIEKIKPSVFANIFILYQNLFLKGLDLGVGVYDIFDEKVKYIQPYNSGHAPLPGPSRELIVKLSYHPNFKRKDANK